MALALLGATSASALGPPPSGEVEAPRSAWSADAHSEPPALTESLLYFDQFESFERMLAAPTLRPATEGQAPRESAFRPRKIAVLKYTTLIEVADQPVIFKLRAPGSGSSIITFEFLYW